MVLGYAKTPSFTIASSKTVVLIEQHVYTTNMLEGKQSSFGINNKQDKIIK